VRGIIRAVIPRVDCIPVVAGRRSRCSRSPRHRDALKNGDEEPGRMVERWVAAHQACGLHFAEPAHKSATPAIVRHGTGSDYHSGREIGGPKPLLKATQMTRAIAYRRRSNPARYGHTHLVHAGSARMSLNVGSAASAFATTSSFSCAGKRVSECSAAHTSQHPPPTHRRVHRAG
jgi:hypothetical protein